MGRIKPLNEVKTKREVETMTEAAKEARRAYKREWNRKNPDKVKEAQRRYWEKRAAEAQDQEEADKMKHYDI